MKITATAVVAGDTIASTHEMPTPMVSVPGAPDAINVPFVTNLMNQLFCATLNLASSTGKRLDALNFTVEY
jgi:hypothetical protein